jgi:hypothetical protein
MCKPPSPHSTALLILTLPRCKCAYTHQYIPIQIKSHRSQKVIKSFHLSGANHLDTVLLWLWRELFVSLLACRTADAGVADLDLGMGAKEGGGGEELVKEMLDDIERAKNWKALERILYGGKHCPCSLSGLYYLLTSFVRSARIR